MFNLGKGSAGTGRYVGVNAGLIITAVSLAAALGAGYFGIDSAGVIAIALIGLLLGAIMCLIAMLITSGKLNSRHALTLPQGSVRAILAFLIIAILVGFVTSFHSAFSAEGRTLEFRTIAAAQAYAQDASGAIYLGQTAVYLPHQISDSHADLMETVTVALLTIFASLGAFYFGTRASADGFAQGEEEVKKEGTPAAPAAKGSKTPAPKGDTP